MSGSAVVCAQQPAQLPPDVGTTAGGSGVATSDPVPVAQEPVPETAMDPMPDIGIAWPDADGGVDTNLFASPAPVLEDAQSVGAEASGAEAVAGGNAAPGPTPPAPDGVILVDPSQSEERVTEYADDGSARRYEVIINGVDDIADDQFRTRFADLSVLNEFRGKAANLAQINRRMKQDAEVLDRLLRAKGYYDARIRPAVMPPDDGSKGRLRVTFDAVPGGLYTLSHVNVNGLDAAGIRAPVLRTAFPVNVGDPIDADRILDAQRELALALSETGFPFSKVDEPVVQIDHETQKGDLDIVVSPGAFRTFGAIIVEPGPKRIFSARHAQDIARFNTGDSYAASSVEDLRAAIVATGLVSSVTLTPRDAGDNEHVDIVINMTRAPMRTIAGEIGYGTGEGYRAEVSWQHRNFFPPEGAITLRGLIGTKEQLAGVAYRRNNFKARDRVLTAAFTARHQRLDAYSARTISLTAGLERQTNILFQKKWTWSVGTELLGSKERNVVGRQTSRTERTYFIAALPTGLTYDGSNDLLDPTEGFRLGGKLSPELSLQGGAFGYVRAQVDASGYMPVADKVVVAGRVRLGTILGSDAERIAPSRRFYAGGGASVRGYAYQSIGPRDANNDPRGGKSLAEFSLEARVRLGVFGLVPFIDAGNISTDPLPSLSDMRYGAGIGLRYYSNFGPIRIDVGTPLNRQKGDGRIAVYVSLGQAF
ncbi:autotransporter assembly complex protein TamA [Sphingobium subterraneum]|uniref:Translocation and assembly module TamA n=1 Tax=Sphingobium subterraneum TaxID=627688 RepID=A0A841IWV2_9SPHN|nr:outer membrane protein assembly factor [Sphingobium subterraneum]MBB6123117.1 translocation and assembly module TamA [Sphingobium subterraneum]